MIASDEMWTLMKKANVANILRLSMRFPGPENRDQNNTSTIVRLTQIQERYFEFSGIHFEGAVSIGFGAC